MQSWVAFVVRKMSDGAQLDFFFGTLAPFLRASDRPMAMACLRLFTTPPLPPFPDLSLPRFSLCMAFLTLSPAALPYFAMCPPSVSKNQLTRELAGRRSVDHPTRRRNCR